MAKSRDKLKVAEIFSSWVGEGIHVGKRCTCVRLYGCNLKCPWCDTRLKRFKSMTVDQVVDEIISRDVPHVMVTGGEPTIQPAFQQLVDELHAHGFYVHVETNGTNHDIRGVDWIAVSPKRVEDYEYWASKKFDGEIKLVVGEETLTFVLKCLRINPKPRVVLHLMPLTTSDPIRNERNIALTLGLASVHKHARVSPRMHLQYGFP